MQEKTALFLGSQEVKQNLAGQATLSPHWAVVAQFRAETEVEQEGTLMEMMMELLILVGLRKLLTAVLFDRLYFGL